jgi:hypothetical protein
MNNFLFTSYPQVNMLSSSVERRLKKVIHKLYTGYEKKLYTGYTQDTKNLV